MRGQRAGDTFSHRVVSVWFIVALAASSFLASCGWPTSDYLYPPSDFSSSGSNLVRLIHETENIDDSVVAALFKGYDIYYRIFDTYSDAYSSYTYLDNNLTSSNIATVTSSKGYYVLAKYDKINTAPDTTVPLIPVSDNTYSSFDLHLNADSRWTIIPDDTTPLYYILRDKSDSSTGDFYRSSQYESGDHDYAGDGISSGSSVYIVFFAVSYGISSSLSELYSDPIVLEPVQYTPGGS